MNTPPPRSLLRQLALAGAALGAAWSLQAGTNQFNFDTDPTGILTIVGNREGEVWRSTGGNPGGYLAITDAGGSQYSGVLFDDFDAGLVVASFDFEADFRVGNGTTERPADGFSISLARQGDPLIEVMESGSAATGAYAGGIPEGGSTTGLAVSFDTWAGNTLPDGPDIEGIIVRVDNRTLIRESLPTRHGACDDTTSLQTGPRVANASGEFDGDPSVLCWQRFTASLSEDSKLTVTWKGRRILDARPIAYAASRSRLIFAGRTGGANENHHVDNVRIVTRPATMPVIGGLSALAPQLTISITDSGTTVNVSTIQVQLNGAPATPASVTSQDGVTTIRLTPPPGTLFPSGSTQTVTLAFKDSADRDISGTRTATVAPYSSVPAAYRVASATDPGFNFRVFQLENPRGPGNVNSIVNGENNLAGSFRDPATGLPYDNIAAETGTVTLDMINLNQDAPAAVGNFTSNNGYEDQSVPGIPGNTGSTDHYAAEIWAYLNLPAGYYRMGVNSDDGFTVSTWGNAPDPFGQRLGFFDGGRGASDTLFDFAITESGFYPFRLSWWEGGGGSNVEWFTVNVATGEKILINDTVAGAIKAFRTANGRAFVRTISPFPGFANAQPNQGLRAELVNGTTIISDIQLTVNGSAVTPGISIAGSTTTVTWNPATPLPLGSTHTAVLSYQESGQAERRSITIPWTVRKLAPFDLPGPPDTFWIEAEDYNSNGVNTQAASNTMPYTGGAFDGEPAFVGIDYNNNDNNDSDIYRTTSSGGTDTAPRNVNMNNNINGRWGRQRPGGNEMSVNYKIGWVADGEWQNYTRTVPNGIYTAVAALSHSGTAAGQLRGSLARVTSDPAQPNQTTVPLGSFNAPGSGGWGANDLVPMTGFGGRPAFFKVTSQPTTFRFNLGSGDFDYFILVRTSAPPAVVSASPAPGSQVPRNKASINIQLEDMASSVNQASIILQLNGTDVTSAASISKSGDVTTVAYNIPQAPLGEHTYVLSWTDSNGRADSFTGTFRANVLGTPGQFLIEAEDFNYDGGQTLAVASVMPYNTLAYSNLNAVVNVDYGSNDGNDSRQYRPTLNPNKNMNANGGVWRDRGLWEMNVNYKLGWVDTADFGNYTRTIPAGNYNVWAALSHGNAAGQPNMLRGTLALVGGDITTTNQTLTPLGSFSGPSTGGWGANALVPLMSGESMVVVTSTGAPATYRFTMDSGDFDYFLFVPVEGGGPVEPPMITSVTQSGGNVTITWVGGGTLEVSDNVTGPWVNTGLSSPVTAPIDRATRFGRIRR